MAQATKSEVKLDEAFNGMPGKEVVEELLKLHIAPAVWEAVDLDKEYWKNELDTLVIALKREDVWRFGAEASMQFAIGLAEFVRASGCDEFDTYTIGGRTAIRLWWD